MAEQLDARLRAVPPETFHRLLRAVARIDRLAGWWEGVMRNPPPFLPSIREKAFADTAEASARLARSSVPPSFAPGPAPVFGKGAPDPQDVAVRAGVLDALAEAHDDFPGAPLDADGLEERIRRFHATLFRHSPADAAQRGRYKTASGRATSLHRWGLEPVALRPSDPILIPGKMSSLAGWTVARIGPGEEFHPLLVIANFLLEFFSIRPFADGNGRAGRILTSHLLGTSGYAFAPYVSLDQRILARLNEVLLAMRKSQAARNLPRPDVCAWFFAFLDVVEAPLAQLKERWSERPGEQALSDNQRRTLGLAHRHEAISNRLVASELGIPRETAKQTLNRLVALNLLVRMGAGRAVRYRRHPGERNNIP